MQKIVFAIFFVVAAAGAVVLLISQVPLGKEYYNVVDVRSFSDGQPLTFYWTLETDVTYRFEVKSVNWTNSTRHYFQCARENRTELYVSPGALAEPPWVWYRTQVRGTMNVTFYHFSAPQYEKEPEIERATASTIVEISQLKHGTYRLTYLIYVGLPLLIIGVILITITGKDVDSARHRNSISQMIESKQE